MMPGTRRFARTRLATGMLLLVLCTAAAGAEPEVRWTFHPSEAPVRAPALPPDLPIQLILDDDSTGADFGVGGTGATAKQFMWFNQFPSPGEMLLEQIWVLYSPGPNMAVGNDIQLAVYHDPDADPSNGAILLATYDVTIQVLDGSTFSVYPLPAELQLPAGGDILIGAISRFVVSDVTGPTDPAALDTTTSQGRSWVAVWSDDPPAPPVLPPNLLLDVVDVFVPPSGGNWMIRGFGSQSSIVIPTLGPAALGLLVLLIGTIALRRLRRRGSSAA